MTISRANIPRELKRGRKVVEKKKKKPGKLGSGSRFKALSSKIQKSGKGKSKEAADAIAASIGRKKYGKKKMAQLSAKGRKKNV